MNLKEKLKDTEKVITMLQDNYGVLQREKNSCNTNCPLMEIGDNHVVLHCGGHPIKHEISKIIDTNEEKESKIIGLGLGGQA